MAGHPGPKRRKRTLDRTAGHFVAPQRALRRLQTLTQSVAEIDRALGHLTRWEDRDAAKAALRGLAECLVTAAAQLLEEVVGGYEPIGD